MNDVLPPPTLAPNVPTVPSTPLPAKGSALAEAVRAELRAELQKAEYVDFIELKKLRDLAHHGRLLVAVRNPMTRFDARALADAGAIAAAPGSAIPAGAYGGGYGELYDEDECYIGGANAYQVFGTKMNKQSSEWDSGPMAKHVQEQHRKAIEEMLRESPLARALRVDLLEILDRDSFSAPELLEFEQLSTQGLATLEARCGLGTSPQRQHGQRMANTMMGGYPTMGGYMGNPGPWAGSSSQETFGASAIRALGSQATVQGQGEKIELVKAIAVAKEAGLDDVVADLRAQLSPTAKQAKPSPIVKEEA